MLDSLIGKMVVHPQRLFLIDGLGALLSAFLLGVVLVQFKEHIGVPSSTLYILALIPVIFIMYDFICYFKLRDGYASFLKYIAVANILYCAFSIVMMMYHSDTLTALGWTYFIVEIMMVVLVASVELKTAARLEAAY